MDIALKRKLTHDPKEGTLEDRIIISFDALENYNRLVLLISSHSFITHLNIMASTSILLPSHLSWVYHARYKSLLISGPNHYREEGN